MRTERGGLNRLVDRLTVGSLPPAALLVLAGTALLTFHGGLLRVALPVIRADLETGIAGIQLVSLAGLVVVTTLLVAFGRLADLKGPARVYTAGLAGTTAGGLAAAAAPGTGWLVAALAAHGVGWAACVGSGPPLLVSAVDHRARGRGLAAFHMAVAVGLGIGPAVGGFLVDAIGWRGALAVSGLSGLPLAIAVSRQTRTEPRTADRHRRFDLAGAVLLGVGLAALLLLLKDGVGRRASDALLLAVMTVAGTGFVARELQAEHPLVDLGLFTRRGFLAGLTASFLTFVAMAANMFLMPFFLQEHRGHSATAAGAIMAIVPAAILIAAPLAGRVTDRRGARLPATAGLALVTVGVALMAALDRHSPLLAVLAVLALYGIGAALFQSPNITGVLNSGGDHRLGIASGTLSTVGRLGQVAGIAIAGGIWDAVLARPDITASSPSPFRITFLALAIAGALGTLASWLRGADTLTPPTAAGRHGQRPD